MKMFELEGSGRAFSVAVVAGLALWIGETAAFALTPVPPDSGTCPATTRGICLNIDATSSGATATAMYSYSTNGSALSGLSSSGTGVQGASTSGGGVVAESGVEDGNEGAIGSTSAPAPSGYGVYGTATSATQGAGVYGIAPSGSGVYAQGGVTGAAGISNFGFSDTLGQGQAIYGISEGPGGHAVDAICNQACASSSNGLAGRFFGVVGIMPAPGGSGDLTIAAGDGYKTGNAFWIVTSDARVKRDIRPFKLGLAELRQVRPVLYKYNGLGGMKDDGKEYVGVIAQDLEKIAPFMVTAKKAKLRESDAAPSDIKQVDAGAFTYMLINAVKEQHAKTERQDNRLATLEAATPARASMFPSLGVEAGLGLLAVGIVAARERRKRRAARPG